MNEDLQARMRGFAMNALERRGALVEWPQSADEGWAMCESGLAATLKAGELIRLSHRPESGGLCLNLATDFLDRIAPLVEAEPRIGLFKIPELYLKKSALDEPIGRAFTWQNAKVRIKGTSAIRMEYHTWSFLAGLHSEDTWEDLIQVTLNAASGAQLDFPDMLELDGLQPNTPVVSTIPDTSGTAALRACVQVERRAAEFITRLEARRERDRNRLRDYYGALLKETGSRGVSAKANEKEAASMRDAWLALARGAIAKADEIGHSLTALQEAKDKRRAVELELRRKMGELDERYALRASVTPLTWLRLDLPVLAVTCEVFRKQARREHTVYWNPILTALEPMCCSRCSDGIYSVSFSDEEVLPLCNRCAGE